MRKTKSEGAQGERVKMLGSGQRERGDKFLVIALETGQVCDGVRVCEREKKSQLPAAEVRKRKVQVS